MGEMYDNPTTVKKHFDSEFLSEELRQAQWAEFIELKKIITELSNLKKRKLDILDIGIGNARVVKHLSGIEEIWGKINSYDGIDNSNQCVKISKKEVSELKLKNVNIKLLDAINLSKLNKKYDLIITTWFTAGNFYPEGFPFDNYTDRIDLRQNKKFEKIFSGAYKLLKTKSEIVIGSCYIDSDPTRLKQEAFYKKSGMTVITDKKDDFTATKEKFWSQRFTKSRIRSYLRSLQPKRVSFTNLDTYDFAMLVRIKNYL